MSYHCPIEGCINFRSRYSKRDLKEDGQYCTAACCGVMLQKAPEVCQVGPQVSKKSLARTSVVNKTPSTRVIGKKSLANSSTKSGEAHQQEKILRKQDADIVVRVGEPLHMELVYPSLTQSRMTEQVCTPCEGDIVVGPPAMVPAGCMQPGQVESTPLPLSLAPAYLKAMPKRAATPRKVERVKFPRGAICFDGTHFLSAKGKIIPSVEEQKKARLEKRAQRRATNAHFRDRRIAKKKAALKVASLIAQVRAKLAAHTERAVAKAILQWLDSDAELTPAQFAFVKKESEKAFASQARWEEYVRSCKAAHKARVAERAAAAAQIAESSDVEDDWVVVPVRAPRMVRSTDPLENALSSVEQLWFSPHYTPACKQRVQEIWDESPSLRLSLGRFVRALLQGAKFSDAETLEGNFFLLDNPTAEEFDEVSEGIEDEFSHFDPREFAARAGMVQWVKATVASLKCKVIDAAVGCKSKIEELIISEMRKTFDRIMSPYAAKLSHAAALLNSFWDKCAGWVTTIKNKASDALVVLQEHALWALVAMLAGGVVVLAETMLKHCGVLERVGNVLGLFLTLFLASLGFSAINLGAEKMAVLHNTFKIALCKMIQPNNLPSIIPEDVKREVEACSMLGLDAAISAISSVGRSLISFKLGTLMYWGKIGSAFDQLWRGKKAIEELASWLIEVLGSMADTVTGRHLEFFDELSALVGTDVKSWLKRSHDVRLQCQTMDISNRVVLNTIECLLEDGHKLLIGVAGTPRRTSTDFAMVIKKEVEELTLLRARCARAGKFEGTRMYPFWVYVFGESQSGKTIFTNNMLAPELLTEMNLSRDSIYTRPKTDQFWSNYSRQSCIMIDDFYAVKTQPSIESQMIDVVNSQAYPLNMAYLEDKGMLMDSPLVITTCNSATPPTDCDLRDLPSFYNRRAAVVELRRKPDSEYDPQCVDNCTEARLLNPKWPYEPTEPGLHVPLTEWGPPSDVMASLKTQLGEYVGKEAIRMAEFARMRGDRHPIFDFAKDFLKDLDVMGHHLEDHVVEGCGLKDKLSGKKPAGFSYMAVDGRLFVYNALHRLCEVSYDKMPEGLEELTLDTVYNDIHVRLSRGPKNGFVGSFLHELVNKSHCVLSLEKLKDGSSAEMKQFFSQLPLTERVFLRLSQKKIEQIGFEASHSPSHFAYVKLLGAMRATYEAVAANGKSIFLLLAAMICIIVTLYGFFAAFSFFSGGSSVVVATMALKQMDACAIIPSPTGMNDVRKPGKYQPIQHRHITARAALADNATPDWYKLIVEIHTGTPNSFVSACQFKGRSLLLTRHQAYNLKDGQNVVLEYDGQYPIHHIWRRRNMIEFDDNELVVYTSGDLRALSQVEERRFFFEDIEADAPKLFRAHCAVSKMTPQGSTSINEWASDAQIVHEAVTITKYGSNHEVYKRMIPKCIEYGFNAVDFDCGALCVVFVNKQWKVAGLLVGVSDGITCSAILPNYKPFEAKALVYHEEEVPIAPGYSKVGWLYADKTPHMPSKTQFIEVPKKYQPKDVEVKHPAILSKHDERLPEILSNLEVQQKLPQGSVSYDPLINGLEKFSEPMMEVDEQLLRHVADEIVCEWFDCLESPLCDVSLDVAINGSTDEAEQFLDPLVMSTSEGYPFVLSRKPGESGKSRFFEGLPGERKLVEDTPVFEAYQELVHNTDVPELICVECPKDECLPERKILKPKTRLFSILPLHFNLRLREKYLAFAAFMMKNRGRLPCQVGINVYSREWMNIYSRLARVNDIACNCDYQSFDGLMTYQFLDVIADMINKGYKNDDELSLKQRKNLMLAIYGRKSIAGNQVMELRAGIPSGCALTVLLNSIFNELLVRIAYHSLVPPIYRDRFSKTVCLLVYGDDNLIATSQSVIQYFNGNALKTWLAQFGVTITDGKDKTAPTIEERPLHDLDFLKRGFLLASGGRVLAPLSLMSIYSSLVHVRARDNDWLEPLFDNYQNSLRELVLHDDRDLFENHRRFYETQFPMWRGKSLLWNEVSAWLVMQQTHNPNLRTHERMDILVCPSFTTFCKDTGPANTIHALDDKFSLAGPKWHSTSSTYFIVSLNQDLRPGEIGLSKNVVPGAGLGHMPTTAWVRSWASGSCANSIAINDAILDGKHIVFRSAQPHIDAWCAAISFAHGFGYRSMEDSMVLYNNLHEKDTKNLRSFFGWCKSTAPSAHVQFTGPASVSVSTPFICHLVDEFELVAAEEEVYPHITCVEYLEQRGKRTEFANNSVLSGKAMLCVNAHLRCTVKCKGHDAIARSAVDIGIGNTWEERFSYNGCSFEQTTPRVRLPHYAAISKVRALTCLGSWKGW